MSTVLALLGENIKRTLLEVAGDDALFRTTMLSMRVLSDFWLVSLSLPPFIT